MEIFETPSTISRIWDKGKLFLKAMVIFIMALGLWLPTSFIMMTIKERKDRQVEAITEVSNKWAGPQVVNGPFLVIPYKESITDDKGNLTIIKKAGYFMADKLNIHSVLHPEKRHRGIYQVVVYRSDIAVDLRFNPLSWQQLKVPAENILWSEAMLAFSIKDAVKGINEDVNLKWGDSTLAFNPYAGDFTDLKDAFVSNIPLTLTHAELQNNFSMQFHLNGSGQLQFTTAGRDTRLTINSSWTDPSFTGISLPDTYDVSDSGFVANWKFMNHSVPAVWTTSFNNLSNSTIGASLITPVDNYEKTERSVKYSVLCFILTFMAFFLIETIYKKPLHLIQYGLAGLALVLFYTLLLSISEYTGFNAAYIIAGVATIGLVGWYVGSIMRSSGLALFITLVLSVIYAYIFTIIQLQDFSLLMGSIGLFVALAIMMYFSRRLQWSDPKEAISQQTS